MPGDGCRTRYANISVTKFCGTSQNTKIVGGLGRKHLRPLFDQKFYLILNVAVGSTNGWWTDGSQGKPWVDSDRPQRFLEWEDAYKRASRYGSRVAVKDVRRQRDEDNSRLTRVQLILNRRKHALVGTLMLERVLPGKFSMTGDVYRQLVVTVKYCSTNSGEKARSKAEFPRQGTFGPAIPREAFHSSS